MLIGLDIFEKLGILIFAMDNMTPVDLPDFVENTKKAPGAKRPYHKPSVATRQMVMAAVGMGLDPPMISALLDINPKTLRKFYRIELDSGVARANFSVAKTLYGRASGGKDTIASIFWLKARAGWQDTTKTVHEGLPENITVTFALEPPKERDLIERDSSAKAESKLIDVTPDKDETETKSGQQGVDS